jgi:hypothetical protein
MRMIIKSTLITLAMASVAVLAPGVASAANVSVGVAVPIPVVVVAPGPGYSPYDEQYFYEPIFISGSWYHGPHRWKMRNGHRVYLMNGRWHRNEWSGGAYPTTITFRNGGHYRAGHYHGFNGADRINARIRDNRADRREDRRDDRQDRREDRRDDRNDDKSSN